MQFSPQWHKVLLKVFFFPTREETVSKNRCGPIIYKECCNFMKMHYNVCVGGRGQRNLFLCPLSLCPHLPNISIIGREFPQRKILWDNPTFLFTVTLSNRGRKGEKEIKEGGLPSLPKSSHVCWNWTLKKHVKGSTFLQPSPQICSDISIWPQTHCKGRNRYSSPSLHAAKDIFH